MTGPWGASDDCPYLRVACSREARPIPTGGSLMGRELRELGPDLLERQPDALREDDEGDAAEDGARIAPMTGAGSLRGDQASLLVEAKRG